MAISDSLRSILGSLIDSLACLAAYVTNSGVFPKPLSPVEEAKLLAEMQEGDERARNVLIEHNLRLVAHIVKKFENTSNEADDLISIGTIGLIKAINTYRVDRNTRLATYAARCIENEILMHLRSTKRLRGEVMLQDPIGSDKEGNEITLMDILSSDEDVGETVELRIEEERLLRKMDKLGKREKEVLELRYGLNGGPRRTQREISKRLGISRSYVSRIEKKAISKLHEEMCTD
ncbi:MAG: RNA polymerase sporulation sigma factor SigK [Limnochordia bacterium]|nr:RNA polymerase sporulation sigma factor SigK [Limnochordia bacterium]